MPSDKSEDLKPNPENLEFYGRDEISDPETKPLPVDLENYPFAHLPDITKGDM